MKKIQALQQKRAQQAVKLYKELSGEPRVIQQAYTSGVVGSLCGGAVGMVLGGGAGASACVDIGWDRNGPSRPAGRLSVNGNVGVGAHAGAGVSGGLTSGTSNPGDLGGSSRGIWAAGAYGPGAEATYSQGAVCGNTTHSGTAGTIYGFGGGTAVTYQQSWSTSSPSRCGR